MNSFTDLPDLNQFNDIANVCQNILILFFKLLSQ